MNELDYMAIFCAALIAGTIFWYFRLMRIERRTQRPQHPRAKYPEAKLTTKTDRTIIKLYLDEHEEKLS